MMRRLERRRRVPAALAAAALFASMALPGCGKDERYRYVPEQAGSGEAAAPAASLRSVAPRTPPAAPTTGRAGSPAMSGRMPAPGAAAGRGCPEGMARIRDFCMDRFEITLVDAEGTARPYFQAPPRGMDGLRARSIAGAFPQGYLSREAADKACRNAGKRLCTLDEWQSACSGNGTRKFPYGSSPVTGMCNAGKRDPHILDKHFPDIPHMRRTGKHFNDPALLQDPDYLMRTGSKAECVTPEGVYDMDGNLSEWVSDTVQKDGRTHGTFAGDAFSGHGSAGCARKTSAHTSDYHDYSMGARCCSGPSR